MIIDIITIALGVFVGWILTEIWDLIIKRYGKIKAKKN